MKKNLILSAIVAAFAMITMSFTTEGNEPKDIQSNAQPEMIMVSTGANGEIISVSGLNDVQQYGYWYIKDLSGVTNVRNRPNGQICMRLKAWTQYGISTNGQSGGWLRISSIYNVTQDYPVRLHGSSTGAYWIARSILYRQ